MSKNYWIIDELLQIRPLVERCGVPEVVQAVDDALTKISTEYERQLLDKGEANALERT